MGKGPRNANNSDDIPPVNVMPRLDNGVRNV
jgi:hypothetical protein